LLGSGVAALGALLGRGVFAQPGVSSPAPSPSSKDVPDFPEHDPQIDRARVKRFVIAGHFNLEAVKEMLAADPTLINGAIDWGNGDFETALGGASHMGRHDIVEFLLERGARIDIFCAAMMGQLDAVRAFLTLQPKLIDTKGPHGFTLHFHAQVGQERSAKVLDYLQTVKKVELRPVPFLKKPADKADPPKKPD